MIRAYLVESAVLAYAAARPKRHFVGAFAVLLGVVILLLPSPYVIEMPGPTQDVLGKVEDGAVIDITGTGVTTYKDSGKLLLTTVNASGVPGYPIINAQAVWGWSNPQVEVMPREATVYRWARARTSIRRKSNKTWPVPRIRPVPSVWRMPKPMRTNWALTPVHCNTPR